MMSACRWIGVAAVLVVAAGSHAKAQAAQHLSLKDAEQQALASHPQVLAGEYTAEAGTQGAREARSAYFPTVFASVTGADAQSGSRIAAGGLNNPIILDRLAAGVAASQLITDFGRTPDLVRSSTLRADALQQDAMTERASVLLRVDRAYFDALKAQAVLRVAQQTVQARQLVVDQVTALSASGLKSGLDLSFAKVNLAEAQLLLLQAQNDQQGGFATLSAALGSSQTATYELTDEPAPPAPPSDADAVVAQALRDRPDVVAERFQHESDAKFADAERALWFPTVAVAAAAGVTPYRQAGLNSQYSAVGINVSVPLSNGSLFSARHAEASFRALAEEQRVHDLENRVSRDVRLALLNAQTGFQRLDLTNQLLAQASEALDLATSRYNLGLSSIVELTQAQLNQTQAEIAQASARYDYQAQTAALRFQTGSLK
jgi:outer membrane protein